MIRATTLPNTAALAQPAMALPAASFDARARDSMAWFRADGPTSAVRISGDLSAAARGLSVEQHAAAVLAHLRGEADAIA